MSTLPGWKRDLPDFRDYKYAAPTIEKLPERLTLDITFPVYDQGRIGSCSANALAANIQFDRLKNNQLPDFVPDRWIRIIVNATLTDDMIQNFRKICDVYDNSIKIEIHNDHQALLIRLCELIQPLGTLEEFIDSFPIHNDLIWCAIPPMHTIMLTKTTSDSKFAGYKNFIVDWYNKLQKPITTDGILYVSFLHELAHLLHHTWRNQPTEEHMCNEWAIGEYNNNVLNFVTSNMGT